jgi:hypothetical protein
MQRIILRPSRPILTRLHAHTLRLYASASAPPPAPTPAPKPTPGPTKPYQHEKGPTREPSWLTRKLKQSPTAMRVFLKVFGALGYGSSRQVAARRASALYQQLCTGRAEEDSVFWAEGMRAVSLSSSDRWVTFVFLCSSGNDRVSSPPDVPILVHGDEPPCVDTHDASACAPCSSRTTTYPRTHRPLFPRCRRSNPTGSPTTLSTLV